MTRQMKGWVLVGAVVLGGAAWAQDAGTPDAGTAGMSQDPLTTAKQLIGGDENGFLQRLHQGNKTEIELGQLAQQKATDSDVKMFGQRMVTDHQKADQQLQAYAQKKGVTLADSEPSPANDTERAVQEADKAARAKLQAMQGPAFQYVYLAHMVGDHDMDVSKVAAAMEQFKSSGELVQLLQPLSGRLMEHRERAYNLLGRHKALAAQARSSTKSSGR